MPFPDQIAMKKCQFLILIPMVLVIFIVQKNIGALIQIKYQKFTFNPRICPSFKQLTGISDNGNH